LRKRQTGRVQFIDEVLKDLPNATALPSTLMRIVGCLPEVNTLEVGIESETVYANEDQDILLSKPANAAQLAILKRLIRQDEVLVQGSPGTGKTHTIANLIGSLLAEGKSVLVTSHTTKALRVLREQVVEPLRALCVSVLDSDATSRKEREQAVHELARHLGGGRQSFIQQAAKLTEKRSQLLKELEGTRSDLSIAINGEYRPLILAGEEIQPTDAARQVAEGVGVYDWILGTVVAGSPLPLSEAELQILYASQVQLSAMDEAELSKSLPQPADLWSPEHFAQKVVRLGELRVSDLNYRKELWGAKQIEEDHLASLLEKTSLVIDELIQSQREVWRLVVIQAGMEGGQAVKIWKLFCAEVEEIYKKSQDTNAAELIYHHEPKLPNNQAFSDQQQTLNEIIAHLNQDKTLSFLTLVLKSKWKQFIALASVETGKPSQLVHFQALLALVELELARSALLSRWKKQMLPHDVPECDSKTPEVFAFQFVSKIRKALAWHKCAWQPLESELIQQGLRWEILAEDSPATQTPYHHAERLRFVVKEKLPAVIEAEVRRRQLQQLELEFSNFASCFTKFDLSSIVVCGLRDAVNNLAIESYRESYSRLTQLHQLYPIYRDRVACLNKLHPFAPDWAIAIAKRLPLHQQATLPSSPQLAWRYKQFAQELDRRAALSVSEIQTRIERLGDALRETTVQLVEQRAWAALLGKVNESQRQSLLGWVATVKRIGAGTGRTVPLLMRQARREMAQARGAVPVWIMPFSEVTKHFHPVRDQFDVIIVDEASQEGVQGLIAFYMAEKVIVVGDDEQVTPLDVGNKQQPIQDLIEQWLGGLPSQLLFDPKTSIYERAQISFGSAIRLKEHFRCVPEIIQFSNHLSYAGEIKPLRESASTLIKPALVAYRVAGNRIGKTNPVEAETIVSLIMAAIEQPEYEGKTFGVISLLGQEQADEIDKLLRNKLNSVVYEERRILCGDPAQFQGDERDVIFLSMVDSKTDGDGPLSMRADGADAMYKKRYNVAASRAKDQLWVVYSLDHQTQLKNGDLRRRLIEHAIDPAALMNLLAVGEQETESLFEAEVYRLLASQGYRVSPQWKVGAYRIDMVVLDGDKRLAIECDGDRWHYDKVEEDLARQALLERLGWKFVRIRGSVFFRDKSMGRANAMRPVFERLQQMGILPEQQRSSNGATEITVGTQLERIKQRSAVILMQWQQESEL
jgi:very-short-patch-repair endonuclease